MALLLPNISRFDVASLYTSNLYKHINDLRQKVLYTAGVQLITSNPDFAVINLDGIQLDDSLNTPITEFAEGTINKLQESYRHFIRKCLFTREFKD